MGKVVMLVVGINAALGIAAFLGAKTMINRTVKKLVFWDEEENEGDGTHHGS